MSAPFPSGLQLPIVRGDVRKGREHYDPTGGGGPLYNTSKTYREEPVSENFTVGELSQSGGKYSDESRIERRLVVCLQAIRDKVDQPVWVRSAYRSYWRNLGVYKELRKPATDSQHIAGKASDIKVEGMTGLELAKVAVDACGHNVAVGIGLEFAHIDVRGDFRAWAYTGVSGRQLNELRQYREARLLAWKARERRQRSNPPSKQPGGKSQQTAGGAAGTGRAGGSGRR
jgi:flagellar protein FlgJ